MLSKGTRLGTYEILAPLGAGGMGEVYRARDNKLGREVAIKVLPERLATDHDALARFEREAKAVAALSHPNILAIFDFGVDVKTPYAVMELLDGQTLREKLLAGPLPSRKAIDYATQIAQGLAAAHEKGVIHRDLKPDNLFITKDGRVKILDFGLAKNFLAPDSDLQSHSPTVSAYTEPGAILGTVGYMSPEQVRGRDLDARSDIFSFGAVLYEMLTGQRAFRGESPAETMAAIMQREPPSISASSPDQAVSPSLDHLLRRCLEKNPVERFQSARDLAYNLREAEQSSGTSAGTSTGKSAETTSGSPVAVTARRGARWAVVIPIVVILGVAAWLFVGRNMGKEKQNPSTGSSAAVRSSAAPASSSAAPAKSVAVLPFENLSADKNNTYFADGMQDLILTKLSDIGGLKVISRTSTMKYASHPDDLKTVGQQLGVATILEGSVQKAGNQVLINVQLIDANTDAHLWADSYTRTLDNIFGVEGEVAEKIAAALNTKLSPAETANMAEVPTTNQAAYDLFLRAEFQRNRGDVNHDSVSWKASIPLYRQAIGEDPNFALAYARLSYAESVLAWFGGGGLDAKQLFTQGRADAAQAQKLAPDLAASPLALGYSDYYGRGDYAGALKSFGAALALRPNDADALAARGYIERRQGNFDAAIASLQQALAHDPRDSELASETGNTCMMVSRYVAAESWLQRALALDPDNLNAKVGYSNAILYGTGDVTRALAAAEGDAPNLKLQRVSLLTLQRKYRDAIALLESIPDTPDNFLDTGGSKALKLANICKLAGDMTHALPLYAEALPKDRAGLTQVQGSARAFVWNAVADDELGLGHTAEGLDALAKSQAIIATTVDFVYGPLAMLYNAEACAQANRADLAVPLLVKVLATPGSGHHYSPLLLKSDPVWDPIRGNPGFGALLRKYADSGTSL